MKRAFAVLAALLFLALHCAAADQKTPKALTPAEEFQAFWNAFRAAALAHRTDQVAALTAFPFRTRGPVDSDPIVTHTRDSFGKAFDQWMSMDTGLAKESEPMRRHIERKTTISPGDISADGTGARIANFVFKKTKGKWLFTMAYVEE